MDLLSFGAMVTIGLLGPPVRPERLVLHPNSFHAKAEFDGVPDSCDTAGSRQLLHVSGVGNPRMHRLDPAGLGLDAVTVTSVELLGHIGREHPGRFVCGVAFNPYEPQDFESQFPLLRSCLPPAEGV